MPLNPSEHWIPDHEGKSDIPDDVSVAPHRLRPIDHEDTHKLAELLDERGEPVPEVLVRSEDLIDETDERAVDDYWDNQPEVEGELEDRLKRSRKLLTELSTRYHIAVPHVHYYRQVLDETEESPYKLGLVVDRITGPRGGAFEEPAQSSEPLAPAAAVTELFGRLLDYYADKARTGGDVLADIGHIDQFMYGTTSRDPVPQFYLADVEPLLGTWDPVGKQALSPLFRLEFGHLIRSLANVRRYHYPIEFSALTDRFLVVIRELQIRFPEDGPLCDPDDPSVRYPTLSAIESEVIDLQGKIALARAADYGDQHFRP